MPGKSAALILALLFLTGCAVQRIPFNENEYAGLEIKGDKSVSGQIFLVDQLEDKQLGANSEVTLEPVTSYSDHWYEVCYLGNRSLENPDPRYEKYVRRTTADADGKFSFGDIAAGDYYLHGSVYWKAATCSGNIVRKKVPVCLKVNVKESDAKVEVPLTKEFISPTEICNLYNQSDWEKVGF